MNLLLIILLILLLTVITDAFTARSSCQGSNKGSGLVALVAEAQRHFGKTKVETRPSQPSLKFVLGYDLGTAHP